MGALHVPAVDEPHVNSAVKVSYLAGAPPIFGPEYGLCVNTGCGNGSGQRFTKPFSHNSSRGHA